MRRPPWGEQRVPEADVEPSLSGSPNIDELARRVGHAINNPLGALMLNLELALEALGNTASEATDPRIVETRAFIEEALEAAQRIRSVVVELKAMATPSTSKELSPKRGSVDPEPSPESATSNRGSATRVLVVDDDQLVSRALARALGDCDVVVASDARDALASIERGERFDVIVCDLMMPDMTGMDLYDALLEVAPGQVERMIFLSGGAVTTRARDFAATVPNLLLEKPFDIQRLRDIIRSRKR
jgi:CheY-like chemotaxis protein